MLAMVCVGHFAKTHPILESTGKFGINILAEDQKTIAEYYARSDPPSGVISPAMFRFTETGTPFLEGSLASMDCQVVNAHKEGDHTVFIGEVSEIEISEGSPLLFYTGKWMTITQ
jgi:flavin reductase (DIM6/NTAB) family NADH-FMN oxidoreductase RutF